MLQEPPYWHKEIITSKGMAGVPGASFVVLLATVSSIGVPVSGLVIVSHNLYSFILIASFAAGLLKNKNALRYY